MSWEIDGECIDPFRPGLRYRARSRTEFDLLTRQHLDCVRQAFEEATVLVFTPGLTEAWVSRADGAVFPACPGTVAGEFDASRHAFHNMSISEVIDDLNEFIREVRKLNKLLRIILTVSPVPLVATATGGHVLPATIYSKSVLRVAVDEAARANEDVTYFPAYEIVTGPQAPWDFFEPDRRNVSKAAIETVMDALLANCEILDSRGPQPVAATSCTATCRTGAAKQSGAFSDDCDCRMRRGHDSTEHLTTVPASHSAGTAVPNLRGFRVFNGDLPIGSERTSAYWPRPAAGFLPQSR